MEALIPRKDESHGSAEEGTPRSVGSARSEWLWICCAQAANPVDTVMCATRS